MADASSTQTPAQVNADRGWNALMRTLVQDAPHAVTNTRRGIRALTRLTRVR